MELDATIEPTIGPYEVYEDEWFNYKAAVRGVHHGEGSDRVGQAAEVRRRAAGHREQPADRSEVPQPQAGRAGADRRGQHRFSAGDGNRGVQTAAFNLPNDERVIREKGSKRVMLKNNQQAKFDKVLVPISKVALAAADQGNVAFDAFFTHILMHELMHGLGPHDIASPAAPPPSPGAEGDLQRDRRGEGRHLRTLRAAAPGRQGPARSALEKTMYTTFLASSFRSLRFGINEAHGRGQAIQLNYLLDKGGFAVNGDGTFSVDTGKIRTR